MPNIRHAQLRAQGGYSDVYHDAYAEYTDFIGFFGRKTYRFTPRSEGFVPVTSTFEYIAESVDEQPDVWSAVATVWNNRGLYLTIELLLEAMDAALTTAGYTGPGGNPL